MVIGCLAELGCITHRTHLPRGYRNWILLGGIRWVRFGTGCLECHCTTFSIFLHSACLCDAGFKTPLIAWATVQSACLKTTVSGRFLVVERTFLIFAFVILLRQTVIIFHSYYCHLKHNRERRELWRHLKGLVWFLTDLNKKERRAAQRSRVSFNIFRDFL